MILFPSHPIWSSVAIWMWLIIKWSLRESIGLYRPSHDGASSVLKNLRQILCGPDQTNEVNEEFII